MDKLIEQIRSYIQQEKLILPGSGVVAGVSGGADSVCLLLALARLRAELGFLLFAVHVEHGLRGEEALADAEYTQNLCRELDVPCRIIHADVAQEAARRGCGIEEAGRLVRYEAFAEAKAQLAQRADPVRIATAHHADDQAETVLLNLTRGTGLKGMGGIRPLQNDRIHPLLTLHREQIEVYLRSIGRGWRTDASNFEDIYARNIVRHQVMPALREGVNAQAARHLCECAEEARRVQLYLENQAREAMKGQIKEQIEEKSSRSGAIQIPLALLAGQNEVIRDMIWRLCISDLRRDMALKDIGRTHIRDLNRLAGMPCGRQLDLPAGLYAVRVHDAVRLQIKDSGEEGRQKHEPVCVILQPGAAPGEIPVEDGVFTCSFGEPVPENIPKLRYTKWLGYDIMGDAICLRTRQTGDYLVTDEAGARKKLKDYFIDCKIPRDERDHIWLAAQGHHVLWVVGYRISAMARVSSETKHILKLHFTPHDNCGL